MQPEADTFGIPGVPSDLPRRRRCGQRVEQRRVLGDGTGA